MKYIELQEMVELKNDSYRPNEGLVEKYVGLEHISQGTLRLKGHGSSAEVQSQKYKFKKGDILVGKLRPYFRKVVIAPFDGVCSTDIWVLRPKEPYSVEQIFPVVASNKFIKFIVNGSSGTRMPRANWHVAKKFLVKKETIHDPQIEFVTLITKKLNNNDEIINQIQEYTQLLFHNWFIEFNFPNENGEPYRSNGGKMQQTDGRLLPIGWERVSLNRFVTIQTETVNPQEYPAKMFKHFSIPTFDETKTYGNELGSMIKSNKYRVNRKNLLVSKLNPWFKRVVYPFKVDEAICSTEFVVCDPLTDNRLEYLYVVVNTNKFVRTCTKASMGTSNSHKRVKPEYMLEFKVPYNEKIVSNFNKLVKPLVEKIHLAIAENQILENNRDLLLKRLFE